MRINLYRGDEHVLTTGGEGGLAGFNPGAVGFKFVATGGYGYWLRALGGRCGMGQYLPIHVNQTNLGTKAGLDYLQFLIQG